MATLPQAEFPQLDFVDSIIDQLARWIAFLFDGLTRQLGDIFFEIGNFIINSQASLLNFIEDSLFTTLNNLNLWFDRITSALSEFILSARTLLQSAIDQIVDLSLGVIDTVKDFVNSALDNILGVATSALDSISSFISGLGVQIQTIVTSTISTVSLFAQDLATKFEAFISPVLDSISSIIDVLGAKLSESIDVIIGSTESLVESIGERLGNLREAFADAAFDLGTKLVDDGDKILEPFKKQQMGFFEELALVSEPDEVTQLTQAIRDITAGDRSPAELRSFISSEWTRFIPEKGLVSKVFFALMGLIGGAFLLLDVSRLSSQVMLQDFALAFPWQLLTPADASNAMRRGFIDENEALTMIQRQGYSESLSRTVLDLTETFPQEQDLMRMWHRELVTEEQVDQALTSLNRGPAFVTATKEAAFPLPPIGDLILMAVREVFSPEIAEKFGQFEDFPEAFEKEALRQGLTEEWAKRYWAAHWALPSPQQGFEMLHRGVVDETELKQLLRALDVMPFWRDRLIKIAFTPFTRIDIRRMHKIDVLTDEEVLRAYKDIGYNDEKAKKMQQFTLQLTAASTADDDVELIELSRTAILNFFGDGLMDRTRAFNLLVGLGHTEDAADLFLTSIELDEERKERKAEIALTLDLAKARLIDIAQAEARLLRLGLETNEVARAVTQLTRELLRRTKLPTRAEAEKMLRVQAITPKKYRDHLETLGYADEWADAFEKIVGIG